MVTVNTKNVCDKYCFFKAKISKSLMFYFINWIDDEETIQRRILILFRAAVQPQATSKSQTIPWSWSGQVFLPWFGPSKGCRTFLPWTFQPQTSIPKSSTPDFSTMNFSNADFSVTKDWKVHCWRFHGWNVRGFTDKAVIMLKVMAFLNLSTKNSNCGRENYLAMIRSRSVNKFLFSVTYEAHWKPNMIK